MCKTSKAYLCVIHLIVMAELFLKSRVNVESMLILYMFNFYPVISLTLKNYSIFIFVFFPHLAGTNLLSLT